MDNTAVIQYMNGETMHQFSIVLPRNRRDARQIVFEQDAPKELRHVRDTDYITLEATFKDYHGQRQELDTSFAYQPITIKKEALSQHGKNIIKSLTDKNLVGIIRVTNPKYLGKLHEDLKIAQAIADHRTARTIKTAIQDASSVDIYANPHFQESYTNVFGQKTDRSIPLDRRIAQATAFIEGRTAEKGNYDIRAAKPANITQLSGTRIYKLTGTH